MLKILGRGPRGEREIDAPIMKVTDPIVINFDDPGFADDGVDLGFEASSTRYPISFLYEITEVFDENAQYRVENQDNVGVAADSDMTPMDFEKIGIGIDPILTCYNSNPTPSIERLKLVLSYGGPPTQGSIITRILYCEIL